MKYGYYGATPTQSFNNNTGVFSSQSATELRKNNQYSVGSDWVLIQRSTSTGTTSFEFTNCHEDIFRTHVVVIKDIIPTGYDNNPIKLMVGNSSGTYLTDYKIYLEHFALNKNNEAPSFFKNPTGYYKQYLEKIKVHKHNKTKLITTFSWEKSEGKLLKNLEKKLKKHNKSNWI